MIRIIRMCLLAGLMGMPVIAASAQEDYEDDLYFSPSRAKAQEEARRQAQAAADQAAGLGSADSYTAGSSNPLLMDVDVYNRRTQTAGSAAAGKGAGVPDFQYTRRIERFHNPDVVSASNDTALIDYYYSTPSTQDINVYVINNVDPVGPYWSWPSYSYNWGWPSFNFGWNSYWGWNLSWNAGWYNPYWNWGWNWGWSYPWYGPCWGWHDWCWSPIPPHAHHPWGYDRPGASRPHGPSYAGGVTRPGNQNYRPGNQGYRPGSRPNSTRPGNFGYPAGNYYPGNNAQTVRPSLPANGSNGTYTPTNNDRRGRNYNTNTNNSNNRYNAPTHNNSNNSNYWPSNNGGGSRGGGYRSPGSGSRGGGGGGQRGGGGGGHRGR